MSESADIACSWSVGTNGVRIDEHCSKPERRSCQVHCSTCPTHGPDDRERSWQAGPVRVRVTLPRRRAAARAQGAADHRADRRHGHGPDGDAGVRRGLDALARQGARHRTGVALRARRQPGRARPARDRPDRRPARTSPSPTRTRWADQLKDVFREMRDLYRAHPGAARAAMAQIPTMEGSLRAAEGIMAICARRRHRAAGGRVVLRPRRALRRARSATRSRSGSSARTPRSPARRPTTRRSTREHGGVLRERCRPTVFPLMPQYSTEMTAGDGDERFEFGLDVLVSGLAAVSEKYR